MSKFIVGALIAAAVSSAQADSVEVSTGRERVVGQPAWVDVGLTWRGDVASYATSFGVRQVERYAQRAEEVGFDMGVPLDWGYVTVGATAASGAGFLPNYSLATGVTIKTGVPGLNAQVGLRFQDFSLENSRGAHVGLEYYFSRFRVALTQHQGGPVSASPSGVTAAAIAWYGEPAVFEFGYAQGRDTERTPNAYLTQDVKSHYVKVASSLGGAWRVSVVVSQTRQGETHRREGAAVNLSYLF